MFNRDVIVFLLGVALMVPVLVFSAPLEHIFMPGKVIAGHAKYENECKNCHKNFEHSSQRELCLACHKKITVDISKNLGFHGHNREALRAECKLCHTEHKGRNFSIVRLDKDLFRHAFTDFPLKGKHAAVMCLECHPSKVKYRDAPSKCIACHKDNDPHRGRVGECNTCHTELKWSDIHFNHDKTKFPLKGKHKKVWCNNCHPSARYKGVPRTCYACHRLNDVHGERYSRLCEKCHSTKEWKKAVFKHGEFKVIDKIKLSDCYACHKASDVHKGLYSRQCGKCHGTEKWKETIFKHDKSKVIPNIKLSDCYACHKASDVHKGLYSRQCGKCHGTKKWKETIFKHDKLKVVGSIKISDCYACHKKDDIHKELYGKRCEKCHVIKSWKNSIFDHNKTKFSLKDRHLKLPCNICHTGDLYKDKLDVMCYFCHKVNDTHNGRYGNKCDKCHTAKEWKHSIFDHDKSKFSLTGKHKKTSCDTCHVGELYKEKLGTTCQTCHQHDDVHKGKYGNVCAPCHSSVKWKKSTFNHDKTVFAKGVFASCGKCYKERLARTCYACHKSDDVHKNEEGKLCDKCHNVGNWGKKILFDHDMTRFPLIGMHAVVLCEGCHFESTYKGVKRGCVACHKIDDVHKQRLGEGCHLCHNPNGWRFWQFDHKTQTKFPIDGAHEGLECLLCHKAKLKTKNNVLRKCHSCHEKDTVHFGAYGALWKECERCHTSSSFREIKIMR